MNRRIGIYGGSFNPITTGHVNAAKQAFVNAQLDLLFVIPAGRSCYRDLESDPGADVRAKMCEIATDDLLNVSVSTFEIDQGRPVFTAETLKHFRAKFPEDDLFLIVGADQGEQIAEWSDVNLFSQVINGIILVGREGYSYPAADTAITRATGLQVIYGGFVSDCSSSRVREIGPDAALDEKLIDQEVFDLIKQNMYYGAGVLS